MGKPNKIMQVILKKEHRTNPGKSMKLMDQLDRLSTKLQNHFGEKLTSVFLINRIIELDSEKNIKLLMKKMLKNKKSEPLTYYRLSIL